MSVHQQTAPKHEKRLESILNRVWKSLNPRKVYDNRRECSVERVYIGGFFIEREL